MTPLSVLRGVTRSLAHDYDSALNNSPMSEDNDAIEPLFDSEVEPESEFESPASGEGKGHFETGPAHRLRRGSDDISQN